MAAAAGAAEPCATSSVASNFDYLDDVYNYGSHREEGGHGALDLLEVRSCAGTANITLGLRVAGTITTDDQYIEYTFVLWGPETLHVYFSNHTAHYLNTTFDSVSAENSTDGAWLTIVIPANQYGGRSSGWSLDGEAEQSSSGGSTHMADWADLDASGDSTAEDISTETTPFTTPTVAITKLEVTQDGTKFKVTAEGTTTGTVRVMRISMGVKLSSFGSPGTYTWPDYWEEQTLAAGDAAVSFEKVNGSWASWKFTREYTEDGLKGILGSLFSIKEAKLEVRAVAEDGKWGHANQAFQPTTIGSGAGAGGGGGMGTAIVGIVLLVVLVAVVALVIMKKKKAGQAPPVVQPGSPAMLAAPGTPPQPPPPPPPPPPSG